MASQILNFSPNRLITAINIVDNMLFFTDGENEPKKVNIEKFRGKATTGEFKDIPVDHSSGTTHIYNRPFEERDITVIKDHPSILSNKRETIVLKEAFGAGAGDLILDEMLVPQEFQIVNPDNTKVENPSSGSVVLDIEGNSLDGITLENTANFGNAVILDSGFIWSQSESTVEDLIAGGDTGASYLVSSDDIETTEGKAASTFSIVKSDTASPYYDANLVAGDFYAVAFIQLKGQSGRIYSTVKYARVLDKTATITSPTNIISKEPVNEGDGYFEWSAVVGDDGGMDPTEVGIVISQPKINENETTPTVSDLVNNGKKIKGNYQDNKISVTEKPVPNNYYYWEPYIENDNGTVYGNSLSLTDTVTNVFINKGFPQPNVKTLNVTESNSNGDVKLESWYEGNKSSVVNGGESVSEIGFYFSSLESKLVDLINKTYSNNQSTDGTSFKVPINTYNIEEGGKADLTINNYITLNPDQSVFYVPYVVTPTGETTAPLKEFTLPKTPDAPKFYISNLDWNLKPNSTDSNGLKDTIILNYDLDVTDLDETYNIEDIGIIISKPYSTEEIKKSSNGVWTTKDQVTDNSNTIFIKVPQSKLTFTANGDSTKIGRYENTNNIEIQNININEYYNLISENVIPQQENWSAVGYIVFNGQTYYTPVVNKNSDISNQDSTVNSSLIGAPKVFSKNINESSYNNLTHNSVTLNGKVHYNGKNIQEIGFYLSQTKPPGATGGIATIKNDGRSTDLDNWISSATKYVSTTTVGDVNLHLNQTTNEFLDFSSSVTGLTPETKYYFVSFVKPVQTTNTENDQVLNNSESLNDVINSTKWGSIFTLVTPKDPTAFTTATPAPLVFTKFNPNQDLKKTQARLLGMMFIRSKNYSVTTKGFYVKPVSEGTPPTFSNPTNRLNFVSGDTNVIQAPGGQKTHQFQAYATGLQQIDYYAASYIVVNETNETFISDDYVLIENSLNANTVPPEIQSFQLTPPSMPSNKLSDSSSNYSSSNDRGISGVIHWDKEASAGAIPEIANVGAYYITHPVSGQTKPSSISNFLAKYTGSDGGDWIPSSKILTDDQMTFSEDGKTAKYTIPLPDNSFPSANTGRTFFAIGFIEYDDGTFKYSNTVEEFFIPRPKQTIVTADTIYYAGINHGKVSNAFKNGVSVLTAGTNGQQARAYHGYYQPPYIQAKITIDTNWFLYIQQGGQRYTENVAGTRMATRLINQGFDVSGASFGSKWEHKARAKQGDPVWRKGNTLRFANTSKFIGTHTNVNGAFFTPWIKYWIIKDFKQERFVTELRGTNNATAVLENFAEMYIEVINQMHPPKQPPF